MHSDGVRFEFAGVWARLGGQARKLGSIGFVFLVVGEKIFLRKQFINKCLGSFWLFAKLGSFCKITAFSGQRTAFSLEWLGGLGKLGKDAGPGIQLSKSEIAAGPPPGPQEGQKTSLYIREQPARLSRKNGGRRTEDRGRKRRKSLWQKK